MTFPVEIVVDVIEDVVKCHSVAAMVYGSLDLLPEALNAVGMDHLASGMDERLRVINGEMTKEARMKLVASPFVGDDCRSFGNILPDF